MFLPNLSPQDLYSAMIRGCQAVVAAREQLNAINLFPVADRDTGDNLASTANAIIHYAHPHPTFKEMLHSIADASVLGARGNSGIIFSQFFNGFASRAFEKESMTIADFSIILKNVASSVRASIATPVDGTILTMMEVFASSIDKLNHTATCFNALMETALQSLKKALHSTTHQIDALKQANVVDSGAFGFYFFAEGFANFSTGAVTTAPSPLESLIPHSEHSATSDTPPVFRYCTEAMIRSEAVDTSSLLPLLEKQGDCLAFTGNQRICKFHIHTNKPSDVFSILLDHGTIDYSKVDDMRRQFEITHQHKYPIALVTDSGADLPQSVFDEHHVHLIPLTIHLDEHRLLDGYCFDPNLFYQHVNTMKHYPKTSLPSPVLIEEKLRYLSQQYQHVLVISIAKGMSGTFDAISQAALKYDNVKVLDSGTTTGAQGLITQYAGELISAGLPFEDILLEVEEAIKTTPIYVMVDSLDALIRSGRISRFSGRLGRMSGIKPIVSIGEDGKAAFLTKAFSTNGAMSKVISLAKSRLVDSGKALAEYCVLHAGAEEKAHEFAAQTTDAFQKNPLISKQSQLPSDYMLVMDQLD